MDHQIIREYIYAYTPVCPATGETFSIISPHNGTGAMTVFLKLLSKNFNQYNIAMILDSADGIEANLCEYLKIFF